MHPLDVIQAVLIVSGWVLLTWGFASLLVWQVWPISAGVLLLSIAYWGWRHEAARAA